MIDKHRMSNNIVEAAMAKDSWSGSDLALLAQQGPQQLQLHAEKIRQLELAYDDAVHLVLFKDVRFPMLERVVLDHASDQIDEKLFEPYLQPALKDFIFYGGPISDAFLEKLQVRISHIFHNFIS
jgi:hypothetical protein